MRTLNLLLLFAWAASVHAAEPTIHRDLSYLDTKNPLQTLNINSLHPVAFNVSQKPRV